jgi:hypothetical protein
MYLGISSIFNTRFQKLAMKTLKIENNVEFSGKDLFEKNSEKE